MPTPIFDAQDGFIGGLDSVSDPSQVEANQARQLANFRIMTGGGAAQKRGGSQRISAATANSGAILASASHWLSQNKTFYAGGFYVTGSSTIPRVWSTVGGVGGGDVGIYVPFIDATSAEVLYTYLTGNYLIKITVAAFAGASVASTPTPTGATGIFSGLVVYNQRLWYWGGSDNSLYYSALNNGDTLGIGASAGGQIIIRTFGLSVIYSCFVLGSSLMICHQRGVSRLTGFGQSDITVSPQAVNREFRILGRDAFAVADDVAYVMTTRGLYRLTENGTEPVATPDRPDPTASITQAQILAGTTTYRCKVVFNPTTFEVLVWLPVYGIFIYNTVLGAWAGPWTGPLAAALPNALIDVPPYVYACDDSGWVLALEASGIAKDSVLSDGTGGTVVTGTLQCHRMYGQSVPMTQQKTFETADVLATMASSATASTLAVTTVNGGTNTVTMKTPTTSVQDVYNNAIGGAGPYCDLTITDTVASSATLSTYARVEVAGTLLGRG